METKHLSTIANIVLGKNGSRIKHPKSDIYNVEHMNTDLENLYLLDHQNSHLQKGNAGNVVFNLNTYQTAIISTANATKIFDQNFMIIKCKPEIVDPRYLCFVLNCSDTIKRQEAALSQGVIIRRVSTSDIKRMKIPLTELSQQRLIGRIYAMQLHYQWLTKRKMELMDKSFEQAMKSLIKTGKED